MKPDKLPINQIINSTYQDYLKNIPDKSVDVLFTDPPYNQNIKEHNGSTADWDKDFNFTEWLNMILPKVRDTGIILIFNTNESIANIIRPYILDYDQNDANYEIVPLVEWRKTNPRSNLINIRKSEYILVAYNNAQDNPHVYDEHFYEATNGTFFQSANELGIFQGQPNKNGKKHPTSKPIRLLVKLINHFTLPDDIILDTFSGSGSIPLAAWYTHHNYLACEMDPEYQKESVQRLKEVKHDIPRTVFLFET